MAAKFEIYKDKIWGVPLETNPYEWTDHCELG